MTPRGFAEAATHAVPEARILAHPEGAEAAALVAAMNAHGAPRPLAADELLILGHPEAPTLLVTGFLGSCAVWQAQMPFALYELLREAARGLAS